MAGSGGHILVADDNAEVRELLSRTLERAGYQVSAAADGREALRALYNRPPDLILLDLDMPELDGWATLERIRDLTDRPVMIVSASQGELEKVRGLKGGADDYVTKPIPRQELVARVDALLRRSGASEPIPQGYADSRLSIDFSARTVTVAGKRSGSRRPSSGCCRPSYATRTTCSARTRSSNSCGEIRGIFPAPT